MCLSTSAKSSFARLQRHKSLLGCHVRLIGRFLSLLTVLTFGDGAPGALVEWAPTPVFCREGTNHALDQRTDPVVPHRASLQWDGLPL
jgi:hypothetical protein